MPHFGDDGSEPRTCFSTPGTLMPLRGHLLKRANLVRSADFGVARRFLLVAWLCLPMLTACGRGKPGALDSSGYHVRQGKVWYLANWTSEAFVVADADVKTFTFPLPKGEGRSFAKDAKHVFLQGRVIPGADPATFEIFEGRFTRDAKNVYVNHEVYCDDPANFEVVSINFVKNSHSVYGAGRNGRTEVVSNDVANFKLISDVEHHSFCVDSTRVFVNGNELPGAQPQSFKILGGAYSRDAAQTFYFDKPMPPGTDMATLEPLAGGYAKDRARAYYLGKVLPGADAATFEITDPRWPKAKDKNQLYEQGSSLPLAGGS